MLASVCVCLRLASACECSRLCASLVWLSLCVYVYSRVCMRLFTSKVPNACASVCVSRLSRVCMRLASVCVYSRVCVCVCVSRLLVNAYGNWLIFMCLPASVVLSRICMRLLSRLYASTSTSARVCVRRCASVCVSRLAQFMRLYASRVWLSLRVCMHLASACECLRELAHFYASVVLSRVILSPCCIFRLCKTIWNRPLIFLI